jgi:hypothetical protein
MSVHKYKTKTEALDAAEKLGCLGYHKMGDDSYMPCKSHERFKKLNSTKTKEKPEGELEEFVDSDGTMLNSKIPILDPALHPRKTMDQTIQATRNVYDIFRMGYRRYFSETDMSKAFGYDETKFMNAKETIKYLEKELGLDSEDAEDRAEEMGKKPNMDKKSKFKNDRNFVNRGVIAEKDVDEVKEDVISKKSNDGEIRKKTKPTSKVILRNIQALKKQAEKEGLSINDLIKMFKSE